MTPQWLFPARCVNIVDGDTVDVVLDVGFHATRTERLRLLGCNAPEMHAPDPAVRAAAQAAKDYTTQTITGWQTDPVGVQPEWPLVVQTWKSDVFGRYLAHVWPAGAADGDPDLSALLIANGHAVPFKT